MSIGTVLLIVLCNMSSFRASKVLVSLYAIELGASQFIIGVMIAMYSLLPALLAIITPMMNCEAPSSIA